MIENLSMPDLLFDDNNVDNNYKKKNQLMTTKIYILIIFQ